MIESLVMQDELRLGLSVSYIALSEQQSPNVDMDEPDVILILERQLGIRIGGSATTVGALAADEQTAELVGVEVGAPLIWLEDVIEDREWAAAGAIPAPAARRPSCLLRHRASLCLRLDAHRPVQKLVRFPRRCGES